MNVFLFENCGYRVEDNCQRVEKRLEKACSEVKLKFVGKAGAVYNKLCQKDLDLALWFGELVSVREVESALVTEKIESEKIQMVNEELSKTLSDVQVAYQAKTEDLFKAKGRLRNWPFKTRTSANTLRNWAKNYNSQIIVESLKTLGNDNKEESCKR